MKTKFIKSTLFLAIAAGLVSSCVNDDDYTTPPLDCIETTLVANKEVSDIPAAAAIAQYTNDDVIEAYVTSSDEAGNFFKSISFQTYDPTGVEAPIGFSVPVDITSAFVTYEPGRKVLIKMKNQFTDVVHGSMRIGSIFISGGVAQVGRIATPEVKNVLKASCTKVNEDDLVRTLTIAQAKQDANINTLIELDMVQFSDAAITTTYYDPSNPNITIGGATNHLLTDALGNTVIFRTGSFASYAGHPVASGRGKVRGVMTKFNADYQFIARSERDIQLDGPRLVPFFTEKFEGTTVGQSVNLPGWTNYNQVGSKLWESYTGTNALGKSVRLNPFGAPDVSVVSWLITPAINMDTHAGEFLRFQTSHDFGDTSYVQALVSTNWDGTTTGVATATWTVVPASVATTAVAFSVWVNSGNVDLSTYTGNIHVAFRFTGSGTIGTFNGTMELDNIEVYGN